MAIKIYLTRSEKHVIQGLVVLVGKCLEEGAGIDWFGTPYQTVNAKILDRHYNTDSAIKLTEDEIGAIMCAFSVFDADAFSSISWDMDLGALNLAAAKVSVAAEQRATGVLGKLAMSNAAMRGRQSGYWGLQKIKPESFR